MWVELGSIFISQSLWTNAGAETQERNPQQHKLAAAVEAAGGQGEDKALSAGKKEAKMAAYGQNKAAKKKAKKERK